MPTHSRALSALRASFFHFLASLLIATLLAAIVFGLWYPWPLSEMVGGRELFWLVVVVDVVCGPMLTLVLWSPSKSKRELLLDLSVVAIVQVAALAYGMYTVAVARPVHLVFEVDRLRIVTASEIDSADLPQAPENLRQLSWLGPTLVSIRAARDSDELLQSVDLSMAGKEPSLRPNWWQDYSLGVSQVLQRAKPLSVLEQARPAQKELLDKAVRNAGVPASDLRWLPFTSARSMEWIVLLDKETGHPRAYAAIDGFF